MSKICVFLQIYPGSFDSKYYSSQKESVSKVFFLNRNAN